MTKVGAKRKKIADDDDDDDIEMDNNNDVDHDAGGSDKVMDVDDESSSLLAPAILAIRFRKQKKEIALSHCWHRTFLTTVKFK